MQNDYKGSGIRIIFLFVQILKLSVDVTLSFKITLKILTDQAVTHIVTLFHVQDGLWAQWKSAILSNVACSLSFAKSSPCLGTMC